MEASLLSRNAVETQLPEVSGDNPEGFFKAVVDSMSTAVFIVSLSGLILRNNPAASSLFPHDGTRPNHRWPEGGRFSDLFDPSQRASAAAAVAIAVGDLRGHESERLFVRPDGSRFWGRLFVTPFRSAGSFVDGFVAAVTDISHFKSHEENLSRKAFVDHLTGMGNRLSLHSTLCSMCEAASGRKSRDTPFCVTFLDLDGFKPVNDRFGHAAGDSVLIEAARRISSAVRSSDSCFRYGGDEFVVIWHGETNESCHALVERLREALREPFEALPGRHVRVGVSAGTVSVPSEASSPEDILAIADARMYESKRASRGTPAMSVDRDRPHPKPLRPHISSVSVRKASPSFLRRHKAMRIRGD